MKTDKELLNMWLEGNPEVGVLNGGKYYVINRKTRRAIRVKKYATRFDLEWWLYATRFDTTTEGV